MRNDPVSFNLFVRFQPNVAGKMLFTLLQYKLKSKVCGTNMLNITLCRHSSNAVFTCSGGLVCSQLVALALAASGRPNIFMSFDLSIISSKIKCKILITTSRGSYYFKEEEES